MKRTLYYLFVLLFFVSFGPGVHAQAVLIDHNFQTTTLPTGVTSDGVISPTKAADGVCSKGMIQVNSPSGFLQADLSSCGTFKVNMKSTSSSTRSVTIKYKKDGEAAYTALASPLAVSTAASFILTDVYPVLQTNLPISIRIEPTNGNIQIHDLYVTGSANLSNAAEITEFKLPGQVGTEVINSTNGTINISVLNGTALSSVVPSSIVLSSQATINPAKSVAQDFTKEVIYNVTAQDGTTIKTWKVNVQQVANNAKEITAFKLSNDQIGNAVINSANATISVAVPLTSDITNVTPVLFTISSSAVINPSTTVARDFSQPVTYTVTAEDNSTKIWTITVNKVDPNAVYTDYEAEDAEYTGKTDNSHLNYSGSGFVDFLSTGENSILFTVCQQQAGSQTAKFRYSLAKDEIRRGMLFVNDVYIKTFDFARTATFDDWSEETAVVSLVQGINKIKVTWDTTDGPNLDRMSLSGAPCATYTLTLNSTNSGKVTATPVRPGNKYFEGETVAILAENKPNLVFQNWTGDVNSSTNPEHVIMTSNKTITGNFKTVATYKLNVTVNGLGKVDLNPAGGEYAEGTVVTLTASPVLNSTFTGWSGDLAGTTTTQTLTMSSERNVTASFTSNYTFDFNKPIGFASVVTSTYPDFNGPTTGGLNSKDTLWINGPAEFDKLATMLYDRIKAYKNKADNLSAKYAPLTVILKTGIYTGTGTSATTFANSMLTIQEQGDLTIMGEKDVTLKFGINIKRGWNILIRNITFQDYYDDGINIGEPETHHIWIDHCTVGNPTTMPADHEHPDGGIDVKTGASYITISFCKYRNSWKTGLVGHSDNNGAQDLGKLFVTYYCNYFFHTNSRNPRVRFGQVHVLNNLEEQVQLYGIAAANTAQVYAEGNFFLNTDWPMYADRTVADFKAVYGNNSDDAYTSKTGNYPAKGLKQVNNAYDDSGLPVITSMINPNMLNPGGRSIKFDEYNPNLVFTPGDYYQYEALDPAAVRVIVPIYAGADKVDFFAKSAALPLNMLSFNVTLSATTRQATAVWRTSNEVNTDKFEVERSANGRGFINIGNVTAQNMSGINAYTFVDAKPLKALSYYRLKQVDKDGKYKYSQVVAVSNNNSLLLSAYPNPATSNITITHGKASAGATFRIVTLDGKTVSSFNISEGTTITTANVAKLSSGNYLLVFDNGNDISTTKFVKQ